MLDLLAGALHAASTVWMMPRANPSQIAFAAPTGTMPVHQSSKLGHDDEPCHSHRVGHRSQLDIGARPAT